MHLIDLVAPSFDLLQLNESEAGAIRFGTHLGISSGESRPSQPCGGDFILLAPSNRSIRAVCSKCGFGFKLSSGDLQDAVVEWMDLTRKFALLLLNRQNPGGRQEVANVSFHFTSDNAKYVSQGLVHIQDDVCIASCTIERDPNPWKYLFAVAATVPCEQEHSSMRHLADFGPSHRTGNIFPSRGASRTLGHAAHRMN